MRFIQSLLALVCCGFMVGCAHRVSAPSSGERASLVLDNHGGYSHPGRRVALHPDGSYTDTKYTDVIGDERVQRGFYHFNPEKNRFPLSPKRGEMEHLCRVDYDGPPYWVGGQPGRH